MPRSTYQIRVPQRLGGCIRFLAKLADHASLVTIPSIFDDNSEVGME